MNEWISPHKTGFRKVQLETAAGDLIKVTPGLGLKIDNHGLNVFAPPAVPAGPAVEWIVITLLLAIYPHYTCCREKPLVYFNNSQL